MHCQEYETLCQYFLICFSYFLFYSRLRYFRKLNTYFNSDLLSWIDLTRSLVANGPECSIPPPPHKKFEGSHCSENAPSSPFITTSKTIFMPIKCNSNLRGLASHCQCNVCLKIGRKKGVLVTPICI